MRFYSSARSGFTIIELVVVIIVIGILVSIVAIGYENLQRDVRDTERAADVDTIKTALEVYYEQHGGYPSASAGNLHSLGTETLNLPLNALTAPQVSAPNTSLIATTTSTQDPTISEYIYNPLSSSGSRCNTSSIPCPKFFILWRKEKDNSVQRVGSRYGW